MKTKRLAAAIAGSALLAAAGAAHAQVMMGAHIGESSLQSRARPSFSSLEAALGRNIAIDSDYENWGTFPDTGRVQWDIQQGLLPMQSWRIEFTDLDPNTCATAKTINAGVYDTQIIRQARTIRSLGAPVLIRFNYEMTDNAENTCFTGFPVNNNLPLAGQEFIAAWRHVVGRFRARQGGQRGVGVRGRRGRLHRRVLAETSGPGPNGSIGSGSTSYNKTDVLQRVPHRSRECPPSFRPWAGWASR